MRVDYTYPVMWLERKALKEYSRITARNLDFFHERRIGDYPRMRITRATGDVIRTALDYNWFNPKFTKGSTLLPDDEIEPVFSVKLNTSTFSYGVWTAWIHVSVHYGSDTTPYINMSGGLSSGHLLRGIEATHPNAYKVFPEFKKFGVTLAAIHDEVTAFKKYCTP